MSALETQVGGSHYKELPIQPVAYCQRNGLNYCESNVVKYVTRHHEKGGRKDIEKAIHYLQLLLEIEYPDAHQPSDYDNVKPFDELTDIDEKPGGNTHYKWQCPKCRAIFYGEDGLTSGVKGIVLMQCIMCGKGTVMTGDGQGNFLPSEKSENSKVIYNADNAGGVHERKAPTA